MSQLSTGSEHRVQTPREGGAARGAESSGFMWKTKVML
jgi:hypothetical protein